MTIFSEKILKNRFETNVVIKIGTQWFSQRQPDSGVSVPDDHVGLVLDAAITPVSFDITKAKTTISSMTFSLLDKDDIITNYIFQSDDTWINREATIWVGTVNSSTSFSSYKQLGKSRIKTLSKSSNTYKFTTVDPVAQLITPIYTTRFTLDDDMSDSDMSIEVKDVPEGLAAAPININGEFMTANNFYSGAGSNVMVLSSRGDHGSEQRSHSKGSDVFIVYNKQDYAMNLLLDILIDEIGLDESEIIRGMFEDIRDNQLALDGQMLLRLYNVENGLTLIENEILFATNTRLVVIEGRIGVTILDENSFHTNVIDENSIRGNPSYDIDGNKIVNRIYARYDYEWGSDRFLRTDVHEETDSINIYGVRPMELSYRGIYSASNGEAMVRNRATRLLAKLGFPLASLSISAHLNRFDISPAEIVQVSHRYLPRKGAGIGMQDVMEVTSVGISNLRSDPQMRFKCEYTSFGVSRLGLIAPSPEPINITSQSVFEVPDGSMYEAGDKLILWDAINEEFFPDAINEIDSILGNEITMVSAFTTTLGAGVKLFFPDYDECSDNQKTTYAFISPDDNFFAESDPAYRITF
jgi:hypothetical protein